MGLSLRNLRVLLCSQRFELADFLVERRRATTVPNRRHQPRDLLVRLPPVALVPRQLRREVVGLGEALGGFPDQGRQAGGVLGAAGYLRDHDLMKCVGVYPLDRALRSVLAGARVSCPHF
ncbi:MAG: hypothetical protein NTX57_09530 [Armatimonadetes bacterium]|nr:hypothetical protein [Armatimonadota bacterium]